MNLNLVNKNCFKMNVTFKFQVNFNYFFQLELSPSIVYITSKTLVPFYIYNNRKSII